MKERGDAFHVCLCYTCANACLTKCRILYSQTNPTLRNKSLSRIGHIMDTLNMYEQNCAVFCLDGAYDRDIYKSWIRDYHGFKTVNFSSIKEIPDEVA